MTLWLRTRGGWLLVLGLAAYIALWWVVRNDLFGSRLPFTMLIGLGFAVILALSLESRESSPEQRTVRPTGVLDGALVLVMSSACGGVIWLMAPLFLGSVADIIWATWFGAGIIAFGSMVRKTAITMGIVTLLYAVLWAMRYVTGPASALIHPETPALIGWSVSLAVLTGGVAALVIQGILQYRRTGERMST